MLKNCWTKITARYKSSQRICSLLFIALLSLEKKKAFVACTLIKCLAFKNNSAVKQRLSPHQTIYKSTQTKSPKQALSTSVKKHNPATMAFHLSAQSPSVFAASEHAALSHDNRLGVERWWEGKPMACRIPGQRGTRPCDVENHLLSPICTVYSPIYMALHQQGCVCQPSPSHTVSPLHSAIQTQMSLPYSTPSRVWRRPLGFVTISFPYIEWRRKLLSFGFEMKWEGEKERDSGSSCEI